MQKNHISTAVYNMVLNLFELYLYQNINYNTAWDWTARTADCRFYNAPNLTAPLVALSG